MTVQAIRTQKLSNQLAVSPGTGNVLVVMGPSSKGSYAPAAFAQPSDVVATYGQGPLVEAACYAIGNYSSIVLCVRTAASTAAVASAITTTRSMVGVVIASTSACTVDAGSAAFGDYEFGLIVTKVVTAAGASAAQGTLGTDKIYVQWTVDNFRTLSPVTKLPDTSAFTIDLANAASGFDSGIQLDFAAGTLTVGDKFTGVSTAPACTTADIATAITALDRSAVSWEICLLASALSDATPGTGVAGAMDAFIASRMARGLYCCWFGHAPLPTVTDGTPQTDATYQASSAVTSFATYSSSTPALISQSGCLLASKNPTWPAQYILPPAYAIAPFAKARAEEESIADSDWGPLPGISISDGNGNPLGRCHDEALNPGADDARFCVLRSWSDSQGAFVNLPTLMAQSGSDFTVLQRLRVWNLFASVVWSFFRHRLQKGVPYDEATGNILKSFADQMEDDANSLVESRLTKKKKCAACKVKVSRTDDLRVANPTLTVFGGVQPLSYPTFIDLRLGFLLPG